MIDYPDGAADNRRWELFTPRPGDIIVSSPPKAGTTLTQMLCALLVFDGPEFPATLDAMSPWFDQLTRNDDEAVALVEAQQHRRIIKTHTPLDGIPAFDEVTFVSVHRDPRDVFVSWIHHGKNIDGERLAAAIEEAGHLDRLLANRQTQPESWDERFDLWLRLPWQNSVFALERIARHASVAFDRSDDPNVTVLHYADLVSDTPGSLVELAKHLGVPCSPERAAELATHAAFDAMAASPESFAPTTKGQLRDPGNFFRSGTGGEWQELISPDRLDHYTTKIDQLLKPHHRHWLERA